MYQLFHRSGIAVKNNHRGGLDSIVRGYIDNSVVRSLQSHGVSDLKKPYPLPNGEVVNGEEIDFEVEKESFNVYILHDGTKLKVKAVATQIIRLDVYNPDNTPIYIVQYSSVIAADVPEGLKKKA